MNRKCVQDLLLQQEQVWTEIIAKTQTQLRFIGRREMKGLGRVLRERQHLIDKLSDIRRALLLESGWDVTREFQLLRQQIGLKEAEAIRLSEQAVQAAREERRQIAAELRQVKVRKTVQHTYFRSWQVQAVGKKFSAQG